MRRALGALIAAALLSVPLTVPALAQDGVPDPLNFRWMSVSANTAEGSTDQVVMNGNGWVIDGELQASGTYNHSAGGAAPQELLSYGTWQADSLVSLDIIGTYGAAAAGVIVMDVTLFPEGGDPISGALTMNCNIPPAGLFTDLPEGFLLEMEGASFAPVLLPVVEGAGPPMIAIGATIFNILEEPPV